MKKKATVTVSLRMSEVDFKLLMKIAEDKHEGNASLTIREALRKYGKK
jgi:hypothetical protein